MSGHNADTSNGWTIAGIAPVLIATALFIGFLQFLPDIAGGNPQRFVWAWLPALSANLSFYIDGLSLTFALLISGIGVVVMLFSASYLAGHPHQARFSLYLTSFMFAMLGVVLADNLIALFVFWELTTFTSYLLIGFSHSSAESRRSAWQALLVTATGGLALLAAVVLIGAVSGSFEMSQIRVEADILRDSGLYLPILLLVFAAAFTKSAQFPFHFWLPNAMAAPTPVSAYLHSATMVKGGVYLLARMHPSLSGTDVWMWTLTLIGGFTAVFASVWSIRQTDMKQVLAYTTLMALGTLVMLLGAPSGYAITAAGTFLIVHSLYKAPLFLVAGAVDHETGTRDVTVLGGLRRKMPFTMLTAALAGLSMAGMIPFLGFIAKELMYKAGLESTAGPIIVTGAVFAASALMVVAAGIVALRPFWGSDQHTPPDNIPEHEAGWPMVVGPLALAVAGLVFGVQHHWPQIGAVTPFVAAVAGSADQAKHLTLWEGVNAALVLSLATFATGIVLYLIHPRLRGRLAKLESRSFSFDRGWDSLMSGFLMFAGWLAGTMQSGLLTRYMTIVFGVMAVTVAVALFRADLSPLSRPSFDAPLGRYTVLFLLIGGTAVTLLTYSRIAAMAGMGVVGIGVALIFILYGAPDLAITQLLVEVLVVVLFAVAALRLPTLPRRRPRVLHAIIAASLGTMLTVLLLYATSEPINRRLTEFFETASYPEAHGRNIVNVILVDFRALDTFGEIAVVLVAAIAALALLRQGGKGDRT
ncbi:hydrogen gas-evolving membrane-bound hydrogenase subunit E [Qingshengfaniella alkalisoli]|uniref:DUF4040 domain-containing protein n=1 Tax=Qingshengfaniella alkalisoli TaxID=2599296 RepID=A0A5B8I835_9RHOB|nr:hydrogen gas-evolving membrane-bound hydrogenase subunit E [Qingshengfaniella alkalisoli]QDY70075.1 DUF4040 domain-containing protein [Qingshengfaniella alkalisoli]